MRFLSLVLILFAMVAVSGCATAARIACNHASLTGEKADIVECERLTLLQDIRKEDTQFHQKEANNKELREGRMCSRSSPPVYVKGTRTKGSIVFMGCGFH